MPSGSGASAPKFEDPWGNDALLELLPESLIPVYHFVTSPIVIMLGAAVFLIVIAVVLSPSDEVPELSEEVQREYYARADKRAAGKTDEDDDEEDYDDEDDYDEGDDEDDDGIGEDEGPDPTTGKFKQN